MQTIGRVWSVLDEQVQAGRFPGYAAAVRHAGETEVRTGGVLAVGSSTPVQPDTLFRIASVTKPIGAALTLGLVQDGVFTLDDPVARWLPELASPRVLEARDGPLDQTRPAERAITIRHLLTFTAGFGIAMEQTPRQAAMSEDGVFARPPAFEKLSGGLVSTVTDVMRFYCALADGGAPILTRESVAAMTTDHLTGEQRRQALPIVGPASSWGLATGVDVDASAPATFPGRWGWTGGTGTAAYVDPGRDLVGVLLTQRAMTGPTDSLDDFWVAVAELAS